MKDHKFEEVIRRVESGSYSIDSQSKAAYLKCLVLSNRPDAQLQKMIENIGANPFVADTSATATNTNTATPITATTTTNFTNGNPFIGTTSSKPVQVEIVTTWKDNLWGFIKYAIVAGGILFIGYYFISSSQKSSQLPFAITPAHQEVWNVDTKFADVKGIDEAKEELAEIVEYLKNPQKFAKLGARLPKGVLLEGDPGTGKTLLARALAGEAGVPFLYTSGSSFDEMFVGVGPKRIRQLFEDAKKLAPCIIFIDEIDSVGANRKYSQYSSSSKESTLNQLLTEMDGFKSTTGIVVIGATNFAESLDPAMTRPGRFDKHVTVPVPDLKGRKEIIDLYLSKTVPSNGVNSLQLARGTPGFTGADLANLINIAAVKATMQGKPYVDEKVIEEAKDQILMGLARKNQDMDPLTRKVTAYHEGGHALVALYSEGAIPLHKATIIQRGSALGVTVMLPERDEMLISRKKLLARIAVSMGGRAAEELIFGDDDVTGGASSDFQNATSIAYHMVTRLGMSKKIGNVYHNLYLDKNKLANISEQERQLIDEEVKDILNVCFKKYVKY